MKRKSAAKLLSTRKFVRLMPMRVLRVEPDDIIVLQTDMLLDREQVLALRDRAREEFKGYKVVVMTAGLKAGVLRPTGKKK
jgi:hypothetical protein